MGIHGKHGLLVESKVVRTFAQKVNMSLEIHQFPYMSDNYGVLLHDPATGTTACVDAGDATAALSALKHKGWTLDLLLITHHHADHTAGLQEIKEATGATVVGPAAGKSNPIAGLDKEVLDGESFQLGDFDVNVLHTPGHTLDMMNYYLPGAGVLFSGDTLFTMGCGRLFEGDAATMMASLAKLKALPADTTIYCSHEYTLHNGGFALSVDPDNIELQIRVAKAEEMRADDVATVPSTLEEELATNPFLRPDDAAIRQTLGMTNATDLEVFTELRERRNNA